LRSRFWSSERRRTRSSPQKRGNRITKVLVPGQREVTGPEPDSTSKRDLPEGVLNFSKPRRDIPGHNLKEGRIWIKEGGGGQIFRITKLEKSAKRCGRAACRGGLKLNGLRCPGGKLEREDMKVWF